jgi:hypothetical protein
MPIINSASAKADGLQNWIDAMPHAAAREPCQRVVQRAQVVRVVGDGDHLGAPVGRRFAVGLIHRQHQFGAGGAGGRDLGRAHAVDRDAIATVAERANRLAHTAPGLRGVAPQIDDVGAVGGARLGLGQQFVQLDPRRVVDLGQDLDVVSAIVAGGRLAKKLRQFAQIVGTALDRHADGLLDC